MATVSGVITAMVTPFDAGGRVDVKSGRRVARFLIENGSHGLVVNGTTGESPTTDDQEKLDLLRAVIEEVDDGVTVIAGSGSNDTAHSVELTQAVTAAGADAVLLIVAAMDGGQLEDFYGIGRDLGLAVLVEVHSLVELQRAIQVGADLIGINNRDLTTFTTDLEITFELMPYVDTDALIVSESGINNRDHVEALGNVGVDAMLVGEALIRERDIGAKLNELMGR